jgi:spore coat polysaccharide biosynthesis predicted glycosyltransferase SpsG
MMGCGSTEMKVVLRADASVSIGTGHVMRCLTLAGALKTLGADVSFISRAHEGNINDVIADRGFEVARLPAPSHVMQHLSVPIGRRTSNRRGKRWTALG